MTDQAFPDRVRDHEAPHIRHVDVQTLDALLRIEELLTQLVAQGPKHEWIEDTVTTIEPILPKPDPKPAPQAATKKRGGRFL